MARLRALWLVWLLVLTLPVNKWEKKGNQWMTLYACVRAGDQICAELTHTQIFQLRGTDRA